MTLTYHPAPERSAWARDLWLGLRALRARPLTSTTVVATIALAVGATTAVFSVVNGVLLRPLPYPEPERLVRVWQTKGGWMDSPNSQLRGFARRFPLSLPTFNDWTGEPMGFAALGASADRAYVQQRNDGAEVLRGEAVTSGWFTALGVAPELGRVLLAEDDLPGAPRVVVLSHGLWQEQFGAAPDVLGRDLRLNGTPHTIVGVMPRDFRPPDGTARLWAPLSDQEKANGRNSQFLRVVGRLAPGVSPDGAAARLAAVQARLARTFPDTQGDVGSRVVGLLDSVVGDIRSTLLLLLGAVGLVHLIASVNVANLLSVVGLRRRAEFGLKSALGAGTGRLVGSLMLENAMLGGLGGLGGIVLARTSLPLLLRLVPPTVPRHDAIGMDGQVLLFGLAATALTALLVGALPALEAATVQPDELMRTRRRGMAGDRAGARIRGALVISEVALAFVLLVGAGLLGTSFARLWAVDRGFDSEGLVTLSAYPDPLSFPGRDERDRFLIELRGRLRGIPGVSVSATNQVPLSGSTSSTLYQLERPDGPPQEVSVIINVVLENYFDVMSIPVVRGRGFTSLDVRDTPPVAIVDQAAARTLWSGISPLGKRLRNGADGPWLTVVGVVGDVHHQGLNLDVEPMLYVPAWQSSRYPSQWLLRAHGNLAGVVALAREAVATVSRTTPVRSAAILEERIAESVAVPRLRTFFVVGLAAMAGVLALLGVFGVVSLAVTQRTREFGVRMALGAQAGELERDVVASGLKLAAGGVGLGLGFAIPGATLLRGFLFHTEPTDPWTYLLVALGLVLVTAAASYLPARRAAAVDPVTVLNSE